MDKVGGDWDIRKFGGCLNRPCFLIVFIIGENNHSNPLFSEGFFKKGWFYLPFIMKSLENL